MGASARFRLFSDLIARQFPRAACIADIASGGGQLQAELRQRGFERVISWDKRQRNARNRRGYVYGHFDYRNAPREYDLVVGMHPDGATDQIVAYAAKHSCAFVVCPCCVLPTAAPFNGVGYEAWLRHLRQLAGPKLNVDTYALPMSGRNIVLVGSPLRGEGGQ